MKEIPLSNVQSEWIPFFFLVSVENNPICAAYPILTSSTQYGTQFLAIGMSSWPLGTTDQFLI